MISGGGRNFPANSGGGATLPSELKMATAVAICDTNKKNTNNVNIRRSTIKSLDLQLKTIYLKEKRIDLQ